jgi:hypothetical protein
MEQKINCKLAQIGIFVGCNEENLFVYLLNFLTLLSANFAPSSVSERSRHSVSSLFSSSSHWAFVACQSRRCDKW